MLCGSSPSAETWRRSRCRIRDGYLSAPGLRTHVCLTPLLVASHECPDPRVNAMQLETKFLRLRTPVELGSRFGDCHVTWLGGWGRYRLYYLVMVVKLESLRATII